MGKFKQEYTETANAIVSHAIVMPPVDMEDGQLPPLYYFTNNAAWDTGAQFSFISPRVVEGLGLKPYGKAAYMGMAVTISRCKYTKYILISEEKDEKNSRRGISLKGIYVGKGK